MMELYQRGFKPSLLYPARLQITTRDGGRKHFTLVEDAETQQCIAVPVQGRTVTLITMTETWRNLTAASFVQSHCANVMC